MFLFSPVMHFFWEGEWQPGQVEPRRRLFDCELVYLAVGEMQLEIAETVHRLRPPAMVIIPPGVWHESRAALSGPVFRHCVHFDWVPEAVPQQKPLWSFFGDAYDARLVNPVPAEIAPHLPLVVSLASGDDVVTVLLSALEHIRREAPMGVHLLWPVLNTLLTRNLAAASRPVFPSKTARAVFVIRDFIENHYAEPQDYDTYRELTKLSASHLCQAFTGMIGRPPLTYLNDIRLTHACRLLQECAMNVSEVAAAVGIPDPNYFARLFRRKFSQTPSAFLARRRPSAVAAARGR